MQNLKIYKKSPVMRNTALFAIFSVLYLRVTTSFVKGVSALAPGTTVGFLLDNKYLIGTLFVFCIALFKGRKYSKYLYLLFVLQGIYLGFTHYMVALDKFILILNFAYIILSYNFYLFMSADLQEASNTPTIEMGDLYTGLTIDSDLVVKTLKEEVKGEFINWDETTCFVKIDGPISKIKGPVDLTWNFENNIYKCNGLIVTGAEGLGIGIKLSDNSTEETGVFSWSEFYDIINSRGYTSELMA
ncbi:MAG: hypothetical protein ACJAT2_003502 [Bacteriovoracaceae bacterium]|jgi:hypothetical protein